MFNLLQSRKKPPLAMINYDKDRPLSYVLRCLRVLYNPLSTGNSDLHYQSAIYCYLCDGSNIQAR